MLHDHCNAARRGQRRTALGVVAALGLAALPALQVADSAEAATRKPVRSRAITATPPAATRLIASATPVVDSIGAIWSPDARFANGGTTWVATGAVARTLEDNLFLPERWGVKGYEVPVPARGSYKVTINAAEVSFTRAGQRVFSVDSEGVRVASNIDLLKSVGSRTAYTLTFLTTVNDGVLNLAFPASVNNAKVSSLSVQPVTATPLVARVVAGAASMVDSTGTTWSPDSRYADGGSAWVSTAAIAGTTQDEIFRPERWGVRGYHIPVPAKGIYRVTVNESELSFTRAGQRVFSVLAEGQSVLQTVDVAKDVGYNAAWTASFTTTVTDGSLTLALPATVNSAKLASMVVESVAAAEPVVRPVSATVTDLGAPPATPTPAPVTTTSSGPESIFGSRLTMNPTGPRGGGFGPNSVWRSDIRSAPLAANSPAMIANLTGQVSKYYGGNAAFNVWNYQGNVYTVAAEQVRVDLKWDNCQGKAYLPGGLFGEGGQFISVPMPSVAGGSSGNDSAISIYQPSSDKMWTFWKLNKQADGWHACWGGRIDGVSTSPGWFNGGFGTTATGLAGEGGMVNIKDVQAGSIDHALSLAILSPAHWSIVSWPAQRSDGSDLSPDAIPEGTRLRLKPGVDVDALKMHPIAKMVAKAAQTYGFIVTDKAGAVGVSAEGGGAVEGYTGSNPWPTLMNGTPSYAIMAGFPWSELEALPKDYGKPAS
ncbi:MAG TPA: malectin domain-containing carbohydrate-binding protein [Propionibacteriaceae bacterium]|jgi:hypothetical protein